MYVPEPSSLACKFVNSHVCACYWSSIKLVSDIDFESYFSNGRSVDLDAAIEFVKNDIDLVGDENRQMVQRISNACHSVANQPNGIPRQVLT